MMDELIPLTADIVFKCVMGSEQSAGNLRAFLSAVQTDAGFPPLREVSIQNPFNLKQTPVDKESIIDVRVLDEEGRRYNIEVQAERETAFQERTLYYWARAYADQLKSAQHYTHLRRVVGVSILAFTLFPNIPQAHTCYLLRERQDPSWVLTEHCVLHYLELPKVSPALNDALSRWLYYLKNGPMEDETVKVLLNEDHDIREAHERYLAFVQDDEARQAYEDRMKFLRDQASREAAAREEGLTKGREEGREEGRTQTLRETVARMRASGMSPQQIARFTGLSMEEVEGL